MFDFRYHAVSLASVFIALVVGLLLGVAIGDANLVSNAERNLRDSLRRDLGAARGEASTLRSELGLRSQYENATYARLVANRLAGRRIGLLFIGGSSDQVNQDVRTAVEPAGARLVFVAALHDPVDAAGVARRATGTRYTRLATDLSLLQPLGTRIGLQLARGGRLLGQLQASLLSSYSGTLQPVQGLVVMRNPDAAANQTAAESEFEAGIAAGLTAAGIPIVGVETTTATASQIPWYRQQSLSSVDDLDDIAGRAALVYTLAGSRGTFGVKSTAERLLPGAAGQ